MARIENKSIKVPKEYPSTEDSFFTQPETTQDPKGRGWKTIFLSVFHLDQKHINSHTKQALTSYPLWRYSQSTDTWGRRRKHWICGGSKRTGKYYRTSRLSSKSTSCRADNRNHCRTEFAQTPDEYGATFTPRRVWRMRSVRVQTVAPNKGSQCAGFLFSHV